MQNRKIKCMTDDRYHLTDTKPMIPHLFRNLASSIFIVTRYLFGFFEA